MTREHFPATALSPTPAETPSLPSKARQFAGKAVSAIKWLWGIPGIKSLVITRLAQAGVLGGAGALAIEIADKLLAS